MTALALWRPRVCTPIDRVEGHAAALKFEGHSSRRIEAAAGAVGKERRLRKYSGAVRNHRVVFPIVCVVGQVTLGGAQALVAAATAVGCQSQFPFQSDRVPASLRK